jgi:hypothetical protein
VIEVVFKRMVHIIVRGSSTCSTVARSCMHIVQTGSSLTTDLPVITQDNWQDLLDNLALYSSILRQNWNKRRDISRYVEYASVLLGDRTTLLALHVVQNASSNSSGAECFFQLKWCSILLPSPSHSSPMKTCWQKCPYLCAGW